MYPEEAAVDSSPFIDATMSLVSLEDRFTDPFVFGIAFGGYLARRVRLVARLEMPSTDEGADDEFDYSQAPGTYSVSRRKSVNLIYGGALGIVAAYSQAFVFSPGFTFLRTDVGDLGNMVGVVIPFEWTTNRGLRFGFEVGFGRAFGGSRHFVCTPVVQPGTPTGSSCEGNSTTTEDREAGRALSLRFELGFGFNHPQPRKSVL
jgi:hypothetical protein